MKISELITVLQSIHDENGDKEVIIEIDNNLKTIVGNPNSNFRESINTLSICCDEIEKPIWIP